MKRRSWHTEPDPAYPSKSQVKRDLLDLQDFGRRLLDIPAARLAAIPMEDELRTALLELRRLAPSARRRQAQYVGKLLRGVDLEPFRRELELRGPA